MIPKSRLNRLRAGIAAERRRIIEIGRFIHAHPEEGYQEYRACDRLTAYLDDLGFAITRPYAGLETAFRAVLKGGRQKPRIAVLAEYDALAGLGHGCGHNLISTAALTAAAGVAACGRLPGQFELIGTPAEETTAGKAAMVAAGAFQHLDAAIMTHPSVENKITVGCTANRRFTATFHGKAAHAAGAPEAGINALDAAILFFNSVNALRQHLREDARIHGIITHGGEAENVIPERAQIRIGVRSLDEGYLGTLRKRVAACCRSAAKAVGGRVTVKWDKHMYRAFRINRALDQVVLTGYETAGIRLRQGDGCEGRGSLDLANVSQIIPAAHPYFGIVPKNREAVALHTRDFLELADRPYAYTAAIQAGTGLAISAVKLLTHPKTLQAVRKAFRA